MPDSLCLIECLRPRSGKPFSRGFCSIRLIILPVHFLLLQYGPIGTFIEFVQSASAEEFGVTRSRAAHSA